MYAPMEIDGQPLSGQADELPGPHHDLPVAARTATASCRCASPSSAPSTATSASGVLHGMLRVRGFTQDDAHIFCTPEQLADEIAGVLELVHTILRPSASTYDASTSRRGPRQVRSAPTRCGRARPRRCARRSSAAGCRRGRRGRRRVLRAEDRHQDQRRARPRVAGLDDPVRLQPARALRHDLHRRRRPASTRPVMVHRALLGSLERFVGGLIEHFARRVPAVARARAGARAPDLRAVGAVRAPRA